MRIVNDILDLENSTGGVVSDGGHVAEPQYSFACVGALLEREKVENTFVFLEEVVSSIV